MNTFKVTSRSLPRLTRYQCNLVYRNTTKTLPYQRIPSLQNGLKTTKRYSTMPSNTAAYLTAAKARPLEVKPAPLGEPTENQILIKNHAIAINPIDFKLQSKAVYPLSYPAILGEDVAGEVVSVGSNVSRFKPGDRVTGCSAGFGTKKDTDNAFQAYTILESNLTTKLPDNITYEKAVVLPLAITTAAAAMFQKDFLSLQLPTEPAQKPTGQVLLVWGGASSVGSAAIQLAVAAGYEVLTTASSKNFDLVKKLGATQVFDYSNADIVQKLIEALKGKTLAGAFDAVGGPAWAPTVEVVQKSEGKKFVATSVRGFPDPPEGITMKPCFSVSIMHNEIGKAVWEDFMSKALQAGTVVPFPEPVIAGQGLENIQTGIDLLEKGVSAQKVVVTL